MSSCVPFSRSADGVTPEPQVQLQQLAAGQLSCGGDASDPSGTPSEGCFPSPSGQCTPGLAGPLPVAGPYVSYDAAGFGAACLDPASCLTLGVMVEMWDGTQKAIGEVLKEEHLVSRNEAGERVRQRVIWVALRRAQCLTISDGENSVTCSESHLFLRPDGTYVRADRLVAGVDEVMSDMGEPTTIVSSEAAGIHPVVAINAIPSQMFSGGGFTNVATLPKLMHVDPPPPPPGG